MKKRFETGKRRRPAARIIGEQKLEILTHCGTNRDENAVLVSELFTVKFKKKISSRTINNYKKHANEIKAATMKNPEFKSARLSQIP